MQNTAPEEEDPHDLLIESTAMRKVDRPKKLESLIDTQAMRFLEAMDFDSFNNLSGAFEKFMMDAPLFQGDVSFGRAAMALDLTAQLFSTIDTDHNHLLSREEFAYLLQKTTDANKQALSWLVENFNAFSQACFFKDQIGMDDIEAARNVFHGLKVVNEKFGFDKQPSLENLQLLDAQQIKDYLDSNSGKLSAHEATGLKYLLEHIKKQGSAKEKDVKGENSDEDSELNKGKRLLELAGIIDARSLKTLQGLKLNSFESLFHAFAGFLEDEKSFKGETPFKKAANALDTSASLLSGLDMGDDHLFTRDELKIVEKLTASKDKKQLGWLVKHFDAFTKAFFLPGKAKKKHILEVRNLFQGLGFVRENFDCENEVSQVPIKLDKQIKDYLATHQHLIEPQHKQGLDQLIQFMDRHVN